MHDNVYEVAIWLGRVVGGWLRYYAVPTSLRSLEKFVYRLKRQWIRVLRRRSQKDRFTWDKVDLLAMVFWPRLQDHAPMAEHALRRQSPEVGASCLNGHAGICAGGVG